MVLITTKSIYNATEHTGLANHIIDMLFIVSKFFLGHQIDALTTSDVDEYAYLFSHACLLHVVVFCSIFAFSL